jgi:hypothetical protein
MVIRDFRESRNKSGMIKIKNKMLEDAAVGQGSKPMHSDFNNRGHRHANVRFAGIRTLRGDVGLGLESGNLACLDIHAFGIELDWDASNIQSEAQFLAAVGAVEPHHSRHT